LANSAARRLSHLDSNRSTTASACSALLYLCTILAALLLAGCGGNSEDDFIAESGEQQIYQQASRYLDSRSYDLAIRALQALESRYPFGRYAEQAQLELIYAHYGAFETEAAIEAADRFIRLHPQHPNVDYAYYMKGLATATSGQDVLSRFTPTDNTKRDTSFAREAFAEFAQLVSRFPDSPYAPDARQRMIHLRNLLARHEIHVANYYFRRGAYLAAVNRGRYVVEHFQQTPAVARWPCGNGTGLPAARPGRPRAGRARHPGAELSRPSFPGQERRVRHGLHQRRAAELPDQPRQFRSLRPAQATAVRQSPGQGLIQLPMRHADVIG
jgi:outer membrane protein assembly factor BamD